MVLSLQQQRDEQPHPIATHKHQATDLVKGRDNQRRDTWANLNAEPSMRLTQDNADTG